MYKYFAIVFLGEDIKTCNAVARYRDGKFEVFTVQSQCWEKNEDLLGIFSGDFMDYEVIDRETAAKIERRLKSYDTVSTRL